MQVWAKLEDQYRSKDTIAVVEQMTLLMNLKLTAFLLNGFWSISSLPAFLRMYFGLKLCT